jgi:hypothetical protein
MQTISGNEWLQDALNFTPRQILPLICFGDGSSFSDAIQSRVKKLAASAFSKVILHARFSEAVGTSECLFSADYPRQIDPLKLWQGQPVWCGWFGVADEKTIHEYLENRRALDRIPTRAYQHFLFLKVSDLDSFQRTIAPKLEGVEHILFLVAEKAAVNRTENDLAESIAFYLFVSWKRFCDAGTGRMRDALALTGRESVFTLGIGKDIPDYDFCIPDWISRLVGALGKEWTENTGMVDVPDYETCEGILRKITPAETYLIKPVVRPEYPAISFSGSAELFHIKLIQDIRTPGFSAKATLQGWAKRVALLRKLDEFLRFLILPPAKTVIRRKLHEFGEEYNRRFRQFLRIKPDPLGMIEDLGQRIRISREYLSATGDAEVLEPSGLRSLEANIGILNRRVLNIPPIAGALLRFALIAVGVVWLFIGSFVWGNTNPFNDRILRWVAVGSVSALVIMFCIIFARWYLIRRGAARSEQLARQDVIDSHLVEIAQTIAKELQLCCGNLMANLDNLELSRQLLGDALHKGITCDPVISRENRNPRFKREAFDLLFQHNLREMLKSVHASVRQSLESSNWPDFDKERWAELMKTHASEVVQRTLGQISFDQCVKAADFTSAEKERSVHDVVSEARKPALLIGEDFNSPVWLLTAAEWSLYTGVHDEVTIQPMRLNCLMALSPVPVVF